MMKKKYFEQTVEKLVKDFSYKNNMEVPKLLKIVLIS